VHVFQRTGHVLHPPCCTHPSASTHTPLHRHSTRTTSGACAG
jgi:hypothetical protein